MSEEPIYGHRKGYLYILFIVLTIAACKKSNNDTPITQPVEPPFYFSYMQQMCKEHTWTRTYHSSGPNGSTLKQLSDTTLPVTMATLSEILFLGDTLYFFLLYETNNYIRFMKTEQMVVNPYSKTMTYFYNADSIAYIHDVHTSALGGRRYSYYTK